MTEQQLGSMCLDTTEVLRSMQEDHNIIEFEVVMTESVRFVLIMKFPSSGRWVLRVHCIKE